MFEISQLWAIKGVAAPVQSFGPSSRFCLHPRRFNTTFTKLSFLTNFKLANTIFQSNLVWRVLFLCDRKMDQTESLWVPTKSARVRRTTKCQETDKLRWRPLSTTPFEELSHHFWFLRYAKKCHFLTVTRVTWQRSTNWSKSVLKQKLFPPTVPNKSQQSVPIYLLPFSRYHLHIYPKDLAICLNFELYT